MNGNESSNNKNKAKCERNVIVDRTRIAHSNWLFRSIVDGGRNNRSNPIRIEKKNLLADRSSESHSTRTGSIRLMSPDDQPKLIDFCLFCPISGRRRHLRTRLHNLVSFVPIFIILTLIGVSGKFKFEHSFEPRNERFDSMPRSCHSPRSNRSPVRAR